MAVVKTREDVKAILQNGQWVPVLPNSQIPKLILATDGVPDIANDGTKRTNGIAMPTMTTEMTMKPPLPNTTRGDLLYGTTNPTANMSLLYQLNDGIGPTKTDWYRFDRWYSVDPTRDEVSGRHYIFILRPDLNLTDPALSTAEKVMLNSDAGIAGDAFWQYLAQYHPEIIASLTGEFRLQSNLQSTSAVASGSGQGNSIFNDGSTAFDASGKNPVPIGMHSLIPFLTGRVESLQQPDFSIKNYNLTQPYTRYSIPYAASAIESQTGGSFDITFRDDGQFSVRKLFYAWIYYMDGVMRNKFKPKDKYILYNAFDYATSVYDIMVDATGENIIWWSKYTGCFPTSVPISDLSFNKGSAPDSKVSIPFVYYYHEDLNVGSLLDLNFNSLGYVYMRQVIGQAQANQSYYNAASKLMFNPPVPYAAIYNQTVGYGNSFLGKNQVGRPVIFVSQDERGNPLMKLRFMPAPI